MLPSSQVSFPSLSPLPQIGLHVLGVTVRLQVQPSSIVQVEEHPSPVMIPPSSHSSLPYLPPVPQVFVQFDGRVGLPVLSQVHPGST